MRPQNSENHAFGDVQHFIAQHAGNLEVPRLENLDVDLAIITGCGVQESHNHGETVHEGAFLLLARVDNILLRNSYSDFALVFILGTLGMDDVDLPYNVFLVVGYLRETILQIAHFVLTVHDNFHVFVHHALGGEAVVNDWYIPKNLGGMDGLIQVECLGMRRNIEVVTNGRC